MEWCERGEGKGKGKGRKKELIGEGSARDALFDAKM